MPGFVSNLRAREGSSMATEDESNKGNLTPSSSAVSPMAFPPSNSPSTQSLTNGITRSAFEITSVSNAEPDDMEVAGAPSSKDAEEMKNALAREKKDSNRFSSSSGDSEIVETESQAEQNSIDHMTGEAHPMLSNIPSNPSPKPPLDANGPLQGGSSRFRRVNVYPRGRWSVRDIYEPEERHESDQKVALTTEGFSGISPSLVRKQPPPPSSLTTSEYSHDSKSMVHSRSNSEASFVAEQLPHLSREPGALSDRSSSVLPDTVPSLSRTESSSSLMTKSVDGDAEPESHSRDIDTESVTSIPNTHTPDLHSTLGTNTSAEKAPIRHCEACSLRNLEDRPVEDQLQAVESTVNLLKDQLTSLSSLLKNLQTRNELTNENTKLKEKIKELESSREGKCEVVNHSAPH